MLLTLHIITPVSKITYEVEWLEIDTPMGNRVVFPHHAPLIASLKPRSTISFKVVDGTVETRFAYSGVVEIDRTTANIVINDAATK